MAKRFPLSANQEFLCAFDRGDDQGAFGPRHLVVYGWRLQGPLDVATLQQALDDVVVRHEGLRTTIVRDEGDHHARLDPPRPVELTVSDLAAADDAETRDRVAHEFLNEVEGGKCSVSQLFRAELGRFDEQDAVLVLLAHHTVSDGWSLQLIMRDLAILYAVRRGLPAPELPEMRQYGEFAVWQEQNLAGEAVDRARAYWRKKLAGGKFVNIPSDRVRRLEVTAVYSVYRFLIDTELTTAVTTFAKSMRSSPFMVLYSAFNLFLHRRNGRGISDIVTPMITSGRTEPEFQETVGPFFNFIPVRTNLSDCKNFRDLVSKSRATCLEALSYEVPFREIAGQAEPELMAPFMDPNGVVSAFEVFQNSVAMAGQLIGDIRYTDMSRRLISHHDTTDIPDGNLWALDIDPAGDMIGSVRFNSHDFDMSTIVAMVDEYRELLRTSLAFPDAPLNRD